MPAFEDVKNQFEKDKLIASILMLAGDKQLAPFGAMQLQNVQQREAQAARERIEQEQTTYQRGRNAQADVLNAEQRQYSRGRDTAEDAWRQTQAKLAREDRLFNLTQRLTDSQERGVERAEIRRDKGVDKLAGEFEKGGYAELQQSTKDLNAMLARYPEGKNIPGVGGLANIPVIGPGLARLTGGESAKDNQSIVASVRNALLKARSGGAVTDSEATRMMEELQTAVGSGDEDFRKAATRISKTLDARVANLFAGQRPDVVDEYAARGGTVTRSSSTTPANDGWKVTRVK